MSQYNILPVTQRFIFEDSTRQEILKLTPKFGFNGLGEVVFRRTYSRDNENWNDVVIRVIQGVMSIRKEHFYRNTLRWDDKEWQEFARKMALSMFNMEWLPPGRGLWMMGTEFVYTRGAMALLNCFSRDTSFWTDQGLKSFKDFQDGDKIFVKGRGYTSPATVKYFGIDKIWKLEISRNNIRQTISTTANHRWITSDESIKTTKNLKQGTLLFSLDPHESMIEIHPAPDQKRLPLEKCWRVEEVSETDRLEEVWCVVEPRYQEFMLENGILTKNCAATDTSQDLVLSAEWTMDCLMNGVGVGFSTNWRGTATAPDKKDNFTFVIPDSREGWVESLIKLMCAYIESPRHGKNKFPIFDYSLIRPAGLPIRGFGGRSSGPEPLKKMHGRIEGYLDNFCQGFIVVDGNKKEYNHTRLIADIFNSIGACVVAGNVRRSAQICLGDVSDDTFINLKNYTQNPERCEIGWMSNNSVVLKAGYDFENFDYIPEMASRIKDNGEPGMINLYNIQKFGRYGKEMEDNATLVNPCGEIALGSKELCNLSEVFPPRCENPETFNHAIEFATFYASTVTLLPTHRPESNAIMAKNRRIGVSISGVAQWANSCMPGWGQMNYTRITKYLREGYKLVRRVNKELADSAGIPPSIRVTTIKPSGSISLLAGVTPGVHYPVSRYAIRRMRIGKDSPLVKPMIDAGIPHEVDTYSDNTLVFEFVIDHGDVRPCEEVSPWEQFSLVAMLQRCWSDNCVSATIYFDKEKDGKDIEKLLAMYIPVLKSISLLPHSGHGYAQAPYEPIDKETYERRKDSYKKPDFDTIAGNVPEGSKFCSGDTCER